MTPLAVRLIHTTVYGPWAQCSWLLVSGICRGVCMPVGMLQLQGVPYVVSGVASSYINPHSQISAFDSPIPNLLLLPLYFSNDYASFRFLQEHEPSVAAASAAAARQLRIATESQGQHLLLTSLGRATSPAAYGRSEHRHRPAVNPQRWRTLQPQSPRERRDERIR